MNFLELPNACSVNSLARECLLVHNPAVNRAQQRKLFEELTAATKQRGKKTQAVLAAGISLSRLSNLLKKPEANLQANTIEQLERALAAVTPPVPGVEDHQSQPPQQEVPLMPSPPLSQSHWALALILSRRLTAKEADAFVSPMLECVNRFKAERRGTSRERKSEGT